MERVDNVIKLEKMITNRGILRAGKSYAPVSIQRKEISILQNDIGIFFYGKNSRILHGLS